MSTSISLQEKSLRILVVEDEFVTNDMLCTALREMGYTVAGDAMTVEEAHDILAAEAVDFAILDINVRGEGKGIKLGEYINANYGIPFVYLTAYSDPDTIEAATATAPFGYLIKPFSPADIHAAIKVAVNRKAATGSEDVYLRDQGNFVRLRREDIYFVEACRNYVEVHTRQGKHVVRSTMKDMEESLQGKEFFRPHRSFIVNARHVQRFRRNTLVVDGRDLPVSSGRLTEVAALFASL